MSEYKTLFGKAVKALTSDPTDAGAEGQIWYNTTTGSFRTVLNVGAWSSGGNMGTARILLAGAGTQTAALGFGGYQPPSPGGKNATEEYDGSAWTAGGNLGSTRYELGGAGYLTSGLAFGGETPPGPNTNATEEYDGSSWTAGGNMGETRRAIRGAGTQTAALAFGGSPPTTTTNATEEYNGSAWTTGGVLSTAKQTMGGAGIQTAALGFGGKTPGSFPTISTTESYDGSTWTTVNPLNTARSDIGGSGATNTAALAFGGEPATATNSTESWDGTNWTTQSNSLATARKQFGSANFGPNTSSLAFGGTPGPLTGTNATEEWNKSIFSPIAATWASGGNLNTAREAMAGAGTQTAGLVSGGNIYPNSIQNLSEEYNGTSWTEGNNLTTSRRKLVGAGTQTAAVVFGGTTTAPVAPGATGKTEEYDGTSYTEQNDMSTGRLSLMGAGIQNAAWAAGGYLATSVYSNATEFYDGTSWTTSPGTLNTARGDGGSAGTQTAALIFGGTSPLTANSEEFNGTTWSEGNNIPAATRQMASFGTQTYAVGAGGGDSPDNRTTAFVYDGTSWTNTASLSTGREHLAGSGYGTQPGSTGLAVGGSQNGNPMNAQTEEFTGEIVQLDYKTITTS